MSWRTPITLLVLLGVLLGAAFYGWHSVITPATEDDPPAGAVEPACDEVNKFQKGQRIRSRNIIVNIYNAGLIGGLASETLALLHSRGFRSGVSDNAPDDITTSNVTIYADSKRSPPVQLVASQFKGVVRVVAGEDLGPGIDVIVGDGFEGVNRKAKRSLRLHRDVSTCASLETAPS